VDGTSLRKLFHLLKGHVWAVPILVALSFVATFAEGIGIGLVIPFLGLFLENHDGLSGAGGPVVGLVQHYANLLPEGSRLTVLAVSIAALIAVKALLNYADELLSVWISGRISHSIRVALFRQMLDVAYEYICVKDNSKLLNTLEGEVHATTDALTTLFSMITRVCVIIVFATLLILMSWKLTAIVVIGALLISAFVKLFTKHARRLGEASVEAQQHIYALTLELFDSMRIIRAFGQEPREIKAFDAASEKARQIQLKTSIVAGILHPIHELLYASLLIAVIVLAWSMNMGIPSLLVFLVLFYRLQPHIRGIDHARIHLASLAVNVRNVTALLDRSDKPYMLSGPHQFDTLEDAIEFRDVSFSYGDSDYATTKEPRSALQNVSLRFGAGLVTAVVGASGAGKSTLINLLYRLHDPASGSILVDGRVLPDLDIASWRAALSIAGQDADLMGGTVRDNIRYGRPEADEDAVVKAAKMADAHEFIMALPKGYDTRVGERGLFLSGGQRQRLGVARALLREPRILILDEATNSLDSFSEAYIQDTLRTLQHKLTIILVAHRLSTTRHADHVIVLNQGRVAEAGAPDDLVRSEGLFSRLYELQRLSYDTSRPQSEPVEPF
jgi:ATP-binding cassette, subfamily B, bacterial MsbA